MNVHTISTAPASGTLARLLDDELVFSPSIQGRFSNHLAMALVALEQLGAGPQRLQDVFAAHAGSSEAELRDDREILDKRLDEIARQGISQTVRARVPALLAGSATALFHPVIRLAYGLDADHPGQVAAALLDWERRLEVLPVPEPMPGTRRLRDVAAELSAQPAGSWPRQFDLPGISRRPELRAALRGVALDEHTLGDVVAFAIAAHVSADDFITLHLVTGARALHALTGWLDADDAQAMAARALPAMAVAYAAVGAPPLLSSAELDAVRHQWLPSRDRIAERALAATDPHVIKLANVGLVEEERTGDPLYGYVAARVVGLVPAGRPVPSR